MLAHQGLGFSTVQNALDIAGQGPGMHVHVRQASMRPAEKGSLLSSFEGWRAVARP